MNRIGVAVLLVSLQIIVINGEKKYPVQIYYESFCPDCTTYIGKQVCPTWEKMRDVLDIQLFPYGNAITFHSHGNLTVRCQHGPKECLGNIIHACALNLYPFPDGMRFVCCMENGNKSTLSTAKYCAEKLKLKFEPIQKCIKSGAGFQYMVDYGKATDNLNPRKKFVPWTLFNGTYNSHDMDIAQEHFQTVVCKYMGPSPPPQCNSIFSDYD